MAVIITMRVAVSTVRMAVPVRVIVVMQTHETPSYMSLVGDERTVGTTLQQ